MEASASNTTTVQYPIWIDGDKIYCDEAKLKDHLTDELNYNGNDATKITEQINGHMKYGLRYFWSSAAKTMDTKAIRVLIHNLEHSQLICVLNYQDEYLDTALHYCARHERNEVIKVILDSVGEEECYQLLSIRDNVEWRPLYRSCTRGDTESVRVMLNHINQDMRYSLLQMTDGLSNTPLHLASSSRNTAMMKVIHESVTQTQWINLLQMQEDLGMTVLQYAVYWNEPSSIDAIRDSVSDEEWLQLVSSPLPEYNELYHNDDRYQRAVDRIDEMRAATRVKSVLQTTNNSGMFFSKQEPLWILPKFSYECLCVSGSKYVLSKRLDL